VGIFQTNRQTDKRKEEKNIIGNYRHRDTENRLKRQEKIQKEKQINRQKKRQKDRRKGR
jgi:hypothetical protein